MAIVAMISARISLGFLVANTILLGTNAFSPFVPSGLGVSNNCRVNSGLSMSATNDKIRNIAVVAHVDHGKTTLVDALIKQSGVFRDIDQANEAGTTIMDSEDQERERGITILSKNLAVMRDGIKINVMDTPGHADFGGEVERVLNMCDGILLVVDSVEGPKPQTRFVLDKALKKGMQVLVVVNKVDRPAARPEFVVDKTFDLFCDLGASDEQIDFRVIYASGIQGTAGDEPDKLTDDLGPLFDAIIESIPAPAAENTESNQLQALVSNIDYDDFKGKMGIARITNGMIKSGQPVALQRPGEKKKTGKISKLFVFDNLGQKEVEEASAGEIIMFAGLTDTEIGDTLITNEGGGSTAAEPLPPIAIEKPTVRMTFGVNKSPLAGREGKFLTSRMIRDRLFKELDRNVALNVEETESSDRYMVSGRGQLHLTVLIETMRREGFELEIGPPSVIFLENEETGVMEEPWESVEVRVPEEYVGSCVDLFNVRKGELVDMGVEGYGGEGDMSVVKYLVPTRGMLGLRSNLLTATRGSAIIDSVFDSYKPLIKGEIQKSDKGSLLAFSDGTVTSFGCENGQERGRLMCKAGDDVYKGMVIGIHQRPTDLEVNVCKTKALTNMRSATKGITIGITAPMVLSLDDCVEYLAADEILEVTTSKFRMSKNPEMGKKSKGRGM